MTTDQFEVLISKLNSTPLILPTFDAVAFHAKIMTGLRVVGASRREDTPEIWDVLVKCKGVSALRKVGPRAIALASDIEPYDFVFEAYDESAEPFERRGKNAAGVQGYLKILDSRGEKRTAHDEYESPPAQRARIMPDPAHHGRGVAPAASASVLVEIPALHIRDVVRETVAQEVAAALAQREEDLASKYAELARKVSMHEAYQLAREQQMAAHLKPMMLHMARLLSVMTAVQGSSLGRMP